MSKLIHENSLNHCSHLMHDKLAAFIIWPGSTHFDLRLNLLLSPAVGDYDMPLAVLVKLANSMTGSQVSELERLHGWKGSWKE